MDGQITPEPPNEEGLRASLEMIQSTDYQEIAHLRTEALTRGELHPLNS